MAAKRFPRRRSRAAAAPDSEGGARGGGRAEKGTRGEGGARGGGRAKRGTQEEGGGRGEGRETRAKGGARERRGDAWGEGRAGRGPWGSPLVSPRLPSPLPADSLLSARRNWWAGRRRREQWWAGPRLQPDSDDARPGASAPASRGHRRRSAFASGGAGAARRGDVQSSPRRHRDVAAALGQPRPGGRWRARHLGDAGRAGRGDRRLRRGDRRLRRGDRRLLLELDFFPLSP